MEARVDIGEIDVVLIAVGQNVRLEVDAFKDRKFTGNVSEIANSSGAAGLGALGSSSSSTTSQEATKFGVKIRIKEKEPFRPGMSVTAEIETRYRTNALTVPIASVTTRLPNDKSKKPDAKGELTVNASTNATAANTNSSTSKTNALAADNSGTNSNKGDKKSKESAKPIEVVFLADGERAKMVPVKIGISDDSYWEIVEGLKEGDEVVSGGYRAIGRDLEDGKKIKKGVPEMAKDDKQEKPN
jgi:HlyD family secretion protein